MALSGSPEPNSRTLPSAWTSLDGRNIMQEAQEALDSYKKKDASKGASLSLELVNILDPNTCVFWAILICISDAFYTVSDIPIPLLPSPRFSRATVVVRFKAVGNAPIMKQNFYKITASNRFQAVIQFLRKELGWKQGDPLVRSFLSFVASRARSVC